jgi:lysophospholipase L1-like esterase
MIKYITIIIILFIVAPVNAVTWYPPNGANPQFVFLGDSSTEGYPYAIDSIYTYPYQFCHTVSSCTFLNKGVYGETSNNIWSRWTADVINHSPRYVVIMMGGNDIINGPPNTKSVFLAIYAGMLDSAQANNIIAVVVTIAPCTYMSDVQSTNIDDWNASLQSLVGTYANAVWVDNRTALGKFRSGGTAGNLWDIKTEYNSGDNIHFNATGYLAFAQAVYDTLSISGFIVNNLPSSFSGVLSGGTFR